MLLGVYAPFRFACHIYVCFLLVIVCVLHFKVYLHTCDAIACYCATERMHEETNE